MTLAHRFANYAANLDFDQLDEATVHEIKRRLIDTLACACGARQAEPVIIAKRLASRVQSSPGAHYLGGTAITSPELAAFTNGVLFRYLDYNDTYLSLEPAHPSDNFAATLAAAEYANATGQDFILASVIAYEIQCRLCDAASIRAHGWDHVTYGAISTSAAAARLLGLPATAIEQAINLAGTPNITLRQTRAGELSAWKGCAFANASRNGVFAALLAAEGLHGPAPLFEGEMGFFKQVSGEFSLAPMALENGNGDGFMINKTSIKYWPAEYHSQSAIHAALELRQQIESLDAIASIAIYSFDAAVDIIGNDPEKWRPKTRETADHSLPYCTAVALKDGDLSLKSFDDQHLNDVELLDLVAKIKIFRDDNLTANYPRTIPNRLEVTLTDGSKLVAENECPLGHDRNPMTDTEVAAKFRKMATDVLSDELCDQVLDYCWQLEEHKTVGDLFKRFAI